MKWAMGVAIAEVGKQKWASGSGKRRVGGAE